MQYYPFPLSTDTVGYQHGFHIAAVTPYSQVNAIQEEINYLLQ